MTIYLDSNFFLFCFFDQSSRGENARKLAEKIITGQKAATCALTLDEVMWIVIKNRRREALRQTIESIYAMQNLSIRDVPGSIPLEALALTEQFNLKPRDAFHAAIMNSIGATEIASDDPDFDRVKGLKRIRL